MWSVLKEVVLQSNNALDECAEKKSQRRQKDEEVVFDV